MYFCALYTSLVRNHNFEVQSLSVRFSVWLDFIKEHDFSDLCWWALVGNWREACCSCSSMWSPWWAAQLCSIWLSSSQSVHMHPSSCMSAAPGWAEGVHEGEEDAVGLSGQTFGENCWCGLYGVSGRTESIVKRLRDGTCHPGIICIGHSGYKIHEKMGFILIFFVSESVPFQLGKTATWLAEQG